MPDWMYNQSTGLSYEKKMQLLKELPNPFDPPEPKLTKEEIETKIVEAEEALLEYEDQYASVQADAEVTGDTTEIRALDEAYGECEEALQSYRDMLATVEQKGANVANESMRLIRDLMGDYGIG
jgi:predicted  nucleic acid-binding Zn-ribbon protein